MNKRDMLALRLEGETYEAIGLKAHISRQRVQQLLSPPKSVREKIIKRYVGRCAVCRIRTGRSGHVHHIGSKDGDEYNDLANLELLCLSCHRIKHMGKGLGKVEKEILAWFEGHPGLVGTAEPTRMGMEGIKRESLYRAMLSLERKGLLRRIERLGANGWRRWERVEKEGKADGD